MYILLYTKEGGGGTKNELFRRERRSIEPLTTTGRIAKHFDLHELWVWWFVEGVECLLRRAREVASLGRWDPGKDETSFFIKNLAFFL